MEIDTSDLNQEKLTITKLFEFVSQDSYIIKTPNVQLFKGAGGQKIVLEHNDNTLLIDNEEFIYIP